MSGPFVGFCIPHQEAITISDFLEVDGYRPTVYYAYRPCDEAMLSIADLRGTGWKLPVQKRNMNSQEIDGGIDEIGVFLMGYYRGKPFAFWSGSQLDSQTAAKRIEKNTATTLQVNAAILAAFLWMLRNPRRGLVYPEDLDDDFVLPITDPYTEPMKHVFSNWNPTLSASDLFPQNLNHQSVFQFTNFRAD
jgi:homospermidine synthase